jgi:hypothetical protein
VVDIRGGGYSVDKEGIRIVVPGIEPQSCGHLSAHAYQRGQLTVSVYIYIYIYIYLSLIYVFARAYGYVYKLNNLLLIFVFIWTECGK